MTILNRFTDFQKTNPKDLLIEIRDNKKPIDFQKIDQKRSRTTNTQILTLFDKFINSPEVDKILLWYKSQNFLLRMYRHSKTNALKFYGCNKYVEHNSSNIEWIVKSILHKMLHHNGRRKSLVDNYSLALVGFGFLPLMQEHVSGNQYQGHNTTYSCNIQSFNVSLTNDQIRDAKNILRLVAGKSLL